MCHVLSWPYNASILQILPLNRNNLPLLREDHPLDMADLVTASDFFDIHPSVYKEFKRPITIKLPLPPLDTEEFPDEDMAVMHLATDGSWQLLDVTLKFTKASVSFDTRVLTRCVRSISLNQCQIWLVIYILPILNSTNASQLSSTILVYYM